MMGKLATLMGIAPVALAALTMTRADAAPGEESACALPDLVTVVPAQLQLQDTLTSAEGKKGTGKSQHVEYLRFSNAIGNTGAGPLEIVALGSSTTTFNDAVQNIYASSDAPLVSGDAYICDDPFAPCQTHSLSAAFFFHEQHNHYHLKDVALFAVYYAGDDGHGGLLGAQVGQSVKETFCLIDYVPLRGTKPGSRTYYDCLSTDQCWRSQGINAGWADEYHQSTDLQGVDVTGAPDGRYYLVSTVNFSGIFAESDATNNAAWVSFDLVRGGNGNRKIVLVDHSACASAEWGLDLCGKDWGGFSTNR